MTILRTPVMLLILFYQSFFLALAQIWSNKLRAFLTMLGIIIGVASVTAIIGALSGLKAKVMSDFEKFGTNRLFIAPRVPENVRQKGIAPWLKVRFKPELFDDLLENCPSVKSLSRATTITRAIRFEDRSQDDVNITGVEAAWHVIAGRSVTLGRPITEIDNDQTRPVCLVNSKVQEKLGLDRDCIGQSIMIGSRRFQIVGIIDERPQMELIGNKENQYEVICPFTTAYNDGPELSHGLFVTGISQSSDLSEEAKSEIAFYLRKKRRIPPGDPDTFRIEFIQQYVDQFNKMAVTITLVASGIVGISLLVGGVGIMNIMLVSVSERTREIGLRKAVGARPAAIMLQFLVEAVTLCFVGGLVGVGFGHVLTMLISKIPNAELDRAAIPGWAIALAFGFSAMVGLLFGMFPAIKASRLDPIEALRHE